MPIDFFRNLLAHGYGEFIRTTEPDVVVGHYQKVNWQVWILEWMPAFFYCLCCDGDMKIGTEAWTPISNRENRVHKICKDCMERLLNHEKAQDRT